ncbi:MAG: cell wall hydrolase [bacterium]
MTVETTHLDWDLRRWVATAGICLVSAMMVFILNDKYQERIEVIALAEQEVQDQQIAERFTKWMAPTAMTETGPLPRVMVTASTAEAASLPDLISSDLKDMSIAKIRKDEQRCLAEALYYEAMGESVIGQMGVADVILNRVKSPLYPDTICGVVYQGSTRQTGCQFSFTCDGSLNRKRNQKKYAELNDMAGAVMAGIHLPVSRNATHYHADYVKPYWAANLTPTTSIGAHKFYRFPDRKTIASAAQ